MATVTIAPPSGQQKQTQKQTQAAGRSSRQQPGSACEECRRRKLRCDRQQPQCGTCVETGVTCVMRTTCPPRGPKRGHIRALRNQIAALESRLDGQDKNNANNATYRDEEYGSNSSNEDDNDNEHDNQNNKPRAASAPRTPPNIFTPPPSDGSWALHMFSPIDLGNLTDPMDTHPFEMNPIEMNPKTPFQMNPENSFDIDPPKTDTHHRMPSLDNTIVPVMIYLTPLVCGDLDQLYFDRVHKFAPMIQKSRYITWSKQVEKSKQRLCLQYSMWTMAASLSSQFQGIRDQLYAETRRLLDSLETDKSESGARSLEHAQAWIHITLYEFMRTDYVRGLVSAGRAFRLIQLMHLHEVDSPTYAANYAMDWTELESARRTFWMTFSIDAFTAIHEGLAMTFNEEEIRTRLPAPDTLVMSNQPYTPMPFLSEIIARGGTDQGNGSVLSGFCSSPFAEIILVATICGRSLAHKKRSMVEQSYGEVTADFCRRHQWLSAILSARIGSLTPPKPYDVSELTDPSLIFAALTANMNVLFLCDVIESMPLGTEESHALLTDYKQRSLEAAHETSKLIAAGAQLNPFQNHPFIPIPLLSVARFCLMRAGSNRLYSAQLQCVTNVLQDLMSVNNLAQSYSTLPGDGVAD